MDREANELRVTDRRRVYLDDQGQEKVSAEVEQPNLKPKYVEELEARTAAAEKQLQEVQARSKPKTHREKRSSKAFAVSRRAFNRR